MAITAPPSPPSRQDPATFAEKSDAFLGYLPTLVAEINTESAAIAASKNAAAASQISSATSATNAAGSATTAVNYAIKVDGYASGTDNSAKSWAVGGTDNGQPSLGDAKSWASKVGAVVVAGEYSAKEWAIGATVPSGSAIKWATTTGATVNDSDYSAKEWAIGTTVPSGSAIKWATTTGATVNDSDYSAKEWAIGTTVPSGSAKEWAVHPTNTLVDGADYSAKHYAQSALNAPGTNATSTTSLAIGTGSKALTIQTGKAYSIGQWLIVASTASPSNWLSGQITAYNSTTGSLTVDVTAVGGSGTFAAWTVSLTAAGAFKTINGQSIAGSGAINVIANYSYDNRGSLRSLSPQPGEHASVDGLGLFVFFEGSTEPDDDESCFATATGRWLMEAAHWDVVDSWQLPDSEARDDGIEAIEAIEARSTSLEARFPGRLLHGTATSAITSVGSVAAASFTGTVTGAKVGDVVIATPPAALDVRLAVYARVTAADTVTVTLNNPSAAATSLTSAGSWTLAVISST